MKIRIRSIFTKIVVWFVGDGRPLAGRIRGHVDAALRATRGPRAGDPAAACAASWTRRGAPTRRAGRRGWPRTCGG